MKSASEAIIADLLAAHTGQHIAESRRWRINSALSGVFRTHGLSSVDQLVCLLDQPREHPRLVREVVEALLNNETYFFRDRAMFDQIASRVLPDIARRQSGSRTLSILSAGCSTGQEALSIAMVLAERPDLWDGWDIRIVGVDVSRAAVAAARAGVYSHFEVQRGLGVAQMLRHFSQVAGGWACSDQLRKMVHYREHNLLEPLVGEGPFDLVLCRNVLLYFDPVTRTRAFDRIVDLLRPEGWLMLGAGETVVGHTRKLASQPECMGLYRPVPAPAPAPPA